MGWWVFLNFSFLTREYTGNKTKWAVIHDFVFVFDPGLFFISTSSLTELVGISVNSNLSEIHYFWEVFIGKFLRHKRNYLRQRWYLKSILQPNGCSIQSMCEIIELL